MKKDMAAKVPDVHFASDDEPLANFAMKPILCPHNFLAIKISAWFPIECFLGSVLPLFFMLGIGCRGGVCARKKNLGQGVFSLLFVRAQEDVMRKFVWWAAFHVVRGRKI